MAAKLIRQIKPSVNLYRDDKNGLAWVEDGTSGCGHSPHSNISITGSVRGMKHQGYWKKDARTLRAKGFIYNIDTLIIDHPYDKLAANECQCPACTVRHNTVGYFLE